MTQEQNWNKTSTLQVRWLGWCLECQTTDCRRLRSGRWSCNRCGYEAYEGYKSAIIHYPNHKKMF